MPRFLKPNSRHSLHQIKILHISLPRKRVNTNNHDNYKMVQVWFTFINQTSGIWNEQRGHKENDKLHILFITIPEIEVTPHTQDNTQEYQKTLRIDPIKQNPHSFTSYLPLPCQIGPSRRNHHYTCLEIRLYLWDDLVVRKQCFYSYYSFG